MQDRKAAYKREFRRALAHGLDSAKDFRGLALELGPNPPLDDLRDALDERIAEKRGTDELAA